LSINISKRDTLIQIAKETGRVFFYSAGSSYNNENTDSFYAYFRKSLCTVAG
jgi:hypothetical protein